MGEYVSEWIFRLHKTEYPFYLTYEGLVEKTGDEAGESIRCFLLLSRDHLTVELKAISRITPEDLMDIWISCLGNPALGPHTYSRGVEEEEPSGEAILATTWQFPPEKHDTVKTQIEASLGMA